MHNDDLITRTEEFVRKQMARADPAHDWWHVTRVRRLARRIAEEEPGPVNWLVVDLAALLHDVADWKLADGDLDAAPRAARAWLASQGADSALIEHVAEIVAGVSYRGIGLPTPMRTIEGAVVQDADRLDALGAIGIARAFAYGGARGLPLYDPAIPAVVHHTAEAYARGAGPTLNHFYEKLLHLSGRMQTETGRRLAAERHQVLEAFIERFLAEWEGRDLDEALRR
jgi:uncharacterized protein